MLKLLERTIESIDERLVVLAPSNAPMSRLLGNLTVDGFRHAEVLAELQRLRGRVYLSDGALRREQLSADARHVTPDDERSWHLAMIGEDGRISGCIWYLEHENQPALEQLRAGRCALAGHGTWSARLRRAVADETSRARRERIGYAEVGGWAVDSGARVADCLTLILSTYALSQAIGGALVIATATARHSSARILRRMGGSPFEIDGFTVPSYYDPQYRCEMELLRFDTRRPEAKFSGLVRQLKRNFANIPVVAHEPARLAYAAVMAQKQRRLAAA